ncbi:MAG: MBL fold metallo-hydrolase [Acidobacteria bacterium]|nr:MBL fold metallo-hydrolase [Acidobacteriota bacterium]
MKKTLARAMCAAAVAVLPLQMTGQAQQEVAATIRSGPPPFPTPEQYSSSARAQEHIAEAMRMAGTDLVAEATAFCTPTGPQRPALAAQQAGLEPAPERQLEPIRMFENLYYVGFSDVGAWVIATSDGIILFDALNSADEARDVLVPGLQKVDLDPAQIKYLIIGHGHNDHTGGGKYIQDTYGPTVIMGGPDWDTHLASTRADRPPMKRGLDASDGQTITVGDTTVTLMLTPGHTPGTIAMLLPVKHNGETHTALIMSGSQMRDRPSLVAFEHVFNDFAKVQNAGTMLGGHADILMNKLPQMEALGKQYPTGDHPLLFAPEKFSRYMDIMAECGRSRLAALEDAGII